MEGKNKLGGSFLSKSIRDSDLLSKVNFGFSCVCESTVFCVLEKLTYFSICIWHCFNVLDLGFLVSLGGR